MTPWRLTLALTLIDTCKHRTSRDARPYLRGKRFDPVHWPND